MRKNKGFTLVELIVVVVIIGVLATVAGLSVSTVNATSAKKAASQLDSYLSVIRSDCMTRSGAPHAVLSVENDAVIGKYYENGAVVKSEVVTDRRVTISVRYDDAGAVPLSANSLDLSFKRSTGQLDLRSIGVNNSTALKNAGKLYITITGGSKTYTITVIAATGNHEITEGVA